MESYQVVRTIGKGSYGKVCLATHRTTGQQVALKIFKISELKTERVRKRLLREIEIMKKLSGHDNIVKFIDSFQTQTEVVIVMEYLPGGELFQYVWERDGLTEKQAKPLFYQIATAVSHCHKNKIAHRDLKLENILMDGEGHPKIADFGFSKGSHSSYQTATCCGSPLYAAPEMVFAKPYLGPECDVWSMGVILYTMLTACMPFDDSNIPLFMQYIETGDYPEPEELSESAKHLISRMLDSNGKTRASIAEVLAHPWLQSVVKKEPTVYKQRRNRRVGVCNSPSDADEITSKLIATKITQCDCSCHTSLPIGRDSAFIEHCDECRNISPIPSASLFSTTHKSRKGTLSTSSSGYSSTDSLSNFSCQTPDKDVSDKQSKDEKTPFPQSQDFDALIFI